MVLYLLLFLLPQLLFIQASFILCFFLLDLVLNLLSLCLDLEAPFQLIGKPPLYFLLEFLLKMSLEIPLALNMLVELPLLLSEHGFLSP